MSDVASNTPTKRARTRRTWAWCPHCTGRVKGFASRMLSPLVREIYFECTNPECMHRFVAHLGFVRTLVPSMLANDDIAASMVERRSNDIVVAAPDAPPTSSEAPDSSPAPASSQPTPLMVLN